MGIYCIREINSGEIYIGSSVNFTRRKKLHFRQLRQNKHPNYKIQRLYNKLSEDAFVFCVLEYVPDKNDLIPREQYFLDTYHPQLNILKKADSSLGIKRSKETIEKIRKANLGLKHPEWRNEIKSIAQGGENHWTKKREKPFSEKSKKKMSDTHKKLYANGYKHPRLGKVETYDQKKWKFTSVDQYTKDGDFIQTWDSTKNAGDVLGISSFGITNACRGKSKTSGGFIWKYNQPDKVKKRR